MSSFTKLGEFFVIVSVTSVSVLMYFISALSTLQNIMFGLSNIFQKSQKYHSSFFIFPSECMCVCRCMCMCMYIHVHTFVLFFSTLSSISDIYFSVWFWLFLMLSNELLIYLNISFISSISIFLILQYPCWIFLYILHFCL